MINKVIILLLIIISVCASGFSVAQVITQCPVSIQNDTEYIIADNFVVSQTPCFQINGDSNVVIQRNTSDYIDLDFTLSFAGTNNNIVVRDIHAKSVSVHTITSGVIVNGFELHNNTLLEQPSIINYVLNSATTRNFYLKDVIIKDNYMRKPYASAENTLFNVNQLCNAGVCASINFWWSDILIEDNDFVGYQYLLTGGGGNSNGRGYQLVNESFHASNNNFATKLGVIGAYTLISETTCSETTGSNNYYGFFSSPNTQSPLTQTDDSYVYTASPSGCIIFNEPSLIVSRMKNENNFEYPQLYFSNMILGGYPASGKFSIIPSRSMVLNSSVFINLAGLNMVTLDLTDFVDDIVFDVQSSTRGIRLGTGNILYGGDDVTKRPIIQVSGSISISDSGYFGNNWQIIEYDNSATIENIRFNMNAVDNYGLVRISSQSNDGTSFSFTGNYVDMNFVPASEDRPQFVIGALSRFESNRFDLPSTGNISVIGFGISENIAGGHLIINNDFYGGGFIFSKLTDSTQQGVENLESRFIHNAFRQSGILYSYPFDPGNNNYNLLDSPKLNGSYYYKTTCTNYEFNVGNWYEDWADAGFYNDTNSDGIHDGYNLPLHGWIEYIPKGNDFNGDPIDDYRSVTPYPFSFSTQTGNVPTENVYDTCASFSYNIISPTEQNYTSGYTLTSDWEFSATGYPSMYCYETLNSETSLFLDVQTGDNNGRTYSTTDGLGLFSVRCCDNIQCDNIVKESQIVEFCIGSCDSNLVVINSTSPVAPVVLGCTDPTADNYNPSATQNDGSCTYDDDDDGGTGGGGFFDTDNLFSTDYSESGDSISSLFSSVSTPVGYLIALGFALLAILMIGLLFAIVGWIIR